jgi:hypothetical protein
MYNNFPTANPYYHTTAIDLKLATDFSIHSCVYVCVYSNHNIAKLLKKKSSTKNSFPALLKRELRIHKKMFSHNDHSLTVSKIYHPYILYLRL